MRNYKIVRKTYSNGTVEYWCYKKGLLFWHRMVENYYDEWNRYQFFSSFREAAEYITKKIKELEGKNPRVKIVSKETVWERNQ